MNKMKYIIQILVAITLLGCTDEEIFKSKGDIEVTAGFANTRTTFVEDDGVTHITWNMGDAIGLFTKEQNNLRYTALNDGKEAKFGTSEESIRAMEGEKVYAYYPYIENSESLQKIKLPNIQEQFYNSNENFSRYDFIYALNSIINNKVSLQFKHIFSFIKITIPVDLVKIKDNRIWITIESSEYIAPDSHGENFYFNMDDEKIVAENGANFIYYYSLDEIIEEKEITCYIAILPQTENAELKIYGGYASDSSLLFTKKAPTGGFKPGNIYTLSINGEELDAARKKERDFLITFYKATNGENWTNNTNWCSNKPISEWYGVYVNRLGLIENIWLSSNNLSGTIPSEIENLKEAKSIFLDYNKLEGTIPESITNLTKLEAFRVYSNQLNGIIPENIGNLSELKELHIGVNKLSGTIPKSIGKLKKLTSFRAEFNNLEGSVPEEFADLPLLTDLSLQMNRLSGSVPARLLQCDNWKVWQPDFSIIPQQEWRLTVEVESLYTSTDYSKDGEIFTLQEHSKGNGIKLVIMGDLFVDTDMNPEGVYETRMKEAMEHYFSMEPFGSLREYFDVVAIKAVSKHSQLNQECAFSTNTRSGNIFYGDMDKCMRYAQKAIGNDNLDNVSVIMALNVYSEVSQAFHFDNGFSIAYCPLDRNLQVSADMVHHEANGHGFGYLLDEYIQPNYSSSPTKEDIEHYTQRYEKYGYNANIDFTNDLQNIRWAHFINDSRYSNEKLGAYEGAAYWPKGVYRPTEYSIMYAGGLFNAPSREAIYKRAMKLAYGDSWTYDYEEFVKFDEPGRAEWINTYTRSVNKKTMKDYKHIPPKIFNYPAAVK